MKTNSITIIGHVGAKPERKELRNDKQVIKFSVANQNKRDETTEWFNVDCWDAQLGEKLLKSIDKGARVRVTGSLRVNRFEKKDGSGQDFRLVIRLEEFELVTSDNDDESEPQSPPAKRKAKVA